jgi:hypothetical protein
MDNELTTGQKKGEVIYNSKSVLDLAMFVGIADGLLTPVNKKWIDVGHGLPYQQYLGGSAQVLHFSS